MLDKDEIERILKECEEGKASQEDLEKLLGSLNDMGKEDKKDLTIVLGVFITKNKMVHLLITLLLNIILSFTLLGFFQFLSYNSILTILLAIFLFTILEFAMKLVFVHFSSLTVIKTAGLIFVIPQILIFVLINIILPGFEFYTYVQLLLFALMFLILRLIITIYLRRIIYNKILKK